MRKVTTDFLNKQKVQILDAAIWLPEQERMEFFGELADWLANNTKKYVKNKMMSSK